jgi:hypothetical protein
MWQCVKCREKLDDDFDVSWKCGTSSAGVEDPDFRKADDVPVEELHAPTATDAASVDLATAIHAGSENSASGRERSAGHPIYCPRCDRKLNYVGTKAFHEGTNWGVFGDFGELFVNEESFELYLCPRCGRVEFFVSGLGEEFRPHGAGE